ncbi:MAG: protein-export chaperone SecB [Gammaproteobacteria bacterium]|nr:MAG: protein-export chaperone SecB [Gammaproteobacteria bacterium]
MTENNVVFNFEKIYVKDISFEAPQGAAIFSQQLEPRINVQLNIGNTLLDEAQGLYEVVLQITVRAETEAKKDNTIFLVELQQAGLFTIQGVSEEDLDAGLNINCPDLLLPFARETINDLVGRGGFPQFLLSPVNFEALYEQRLASEKQQEVTQ